MLNSRVLYIIIIIIIIIVTIIIVIYVIIQYRGKNSNATTFTYGDVVTIQSLATNQYVAPGCSYIPSPVWGGIVPGSSMSIVNSSYTDSVSQDLIRWDVVVPPVPSQDNPSLGGQGYAFRNRLTGQYMVIPFQSGIIDGRAVGGLVLASTAQSFTSPIVPNPQGSVINPSVIYESTSAFNNSFNFLFKIGSPGTLEPSNGSAGVFTLVHVFRDGVRVILATAGLPNQDTPTSTCGSDISNINIPYASCGINTCPNVFCPTGSQACVQWLPFGFINSPFYTPQQFLFRIKKAST